MAPKETSDDEGTGILSGLLAPLRLPERALAALETLAETAQNLGPMRSELTRVREQTKPLSELMPAMERLVKQTEPLGELMPAIERLLKQTEPLADLLPALQRLEENLGTRLDSLQEVVVALEGDESHLNAGVRELQREAADINETLSGLKGDIKRITDRLPDPNRGPLEKARDVLGGSGDEEKQ